MCAFGPILMPCQVLQQFCAVLIAPDPIAIVLPRWATIAAVKAADRTYGRGSCRDGPISRSWHRFTVQIVRLVVVAWRARVNKPHPFSSR